MSVPFTFVVPVPERLVTPNSRLHWAAKARMVHSLRADVSVVARVERMRQSVRTAVHGEKRAVHLLLVRGKGQKLLDMDNCVGALKPVLDGLRDAGWIYDDRESHLDYRVSQRKDNVLGPVVCVEVSLPQ